MRSIAFEYAPMRQEITEVIALQERSDVPVHGEPERNDRCSTSSKQLAGFATRTKPSSPVCVRRHPEFGDGRGR